MDLVIGTSNAGKIFEIREALRGLPISLLIPQELGIHDAPHEEGTSFTTNARQKAWFYAARTGKPTVADDSGILVEAMREELGIHTRRWGPGSAASDEEWIADFLKRMSKEQNRRAKFLCTLCYIDHEKVEHYFTGDCSGTITQTLESSFLPGLPISACFKPDGSDVVYAAMKIEQKNYTSHRGKALLQFRTYLQKDFS